MQKPLFLGHPEPARVGIGGGGAAVVADLVCRAWCSQCRKCQVMIDDAMSSWRSRKPLTSWPGSWALIKAPMVLAIAPKHGRCLETALGTPKAVMESERPQRLPKTAISLSSRGREESLDWGSRSPRRSCSRIVPGNRCSRSPGGSSLRW